MTGRESKRPAFRLGAYFGVKGGGVSLAQGGSITQISQLFGAGDDGLLFDPTDITTLSQDSAGAIPVTADGQTVGLMLDKHAWGGKTLAQELASQPEGIRNQTMAGAVVGTPGTMPTNWSIGTLAGITTSVAGTGLDNGVPYIDIGISGTASGTINLFFEGGSRAAAANGQPWLADVVTKLVGGASTNLTVEAQMAEWTNTGGFLTSGGTGNTVSFSASPQDLKYLRVLSGGVTVGEVSSLIQFKFNGGAVSATVRVYAPSLKQLPGNHAIQPTSTKRPLYKTNGGVSGNKPYIVFDGTDDTLVTPFSAMLPPAVGNTKSAAVRLPTSTGANIYFGGGSNTNNKRDYLMLQTGVLNFSWGTAAVPDPNGTVLTGANFVATQLGDASGRQGRLNGVQLINDTPASTPDGTNGTTALGSWNNVNSPTNFANVNFFQAFEISRKLSLTEVSALENLLKGYYS